MNTADVATNGGHEIVDSASATWSRSPRGRGASGLGAPRSVSPPTMRSYDGAVTDAGRPAATPAVTLASADMAAPLP